MGRGKEFSEENQKSTSEGDTFSAIGSTLLQATEGGHCRQRYAGHKGRSMVLGTSLVAGQPGTRNSPGTSHSTTCRDLPELSLQPVCLTSPNSLRFIYVCICMYVCICIYVYTYVCMYIRIYVYICILSIYLYTYLIYIHNTYIYRSS